MAREANAAYIDFRARVSALPVPAVPPRYSSVGASVGIGLLNAALNLNHLSRVAEHLRLIDRTHLDREVQIDVGLDRLTPDQYLAAENYGQLRQRTDSQHPSDADEDDRPKAPVPIPLVWVPIGRLSRSVVTPLPLRDEEGRQVPRATQPELLPVINAAMYILLAIELETGPRGEGRRDREAMIAFKNLLHRTNRARWLIQQAIAEMVYDRSDPPAPSESDAGQHQLSAKSETAEDAQLRALALTVLDFFDDAHHGAFFDLLWHASNEYLVVAGLSRSKLEHQLSYRAPTLPSSEGSAISTPVGRLRRGLVPGREFTVVYTSALPRNLHSYHLTFETDPGVKVREGILTTNNEAPQLRRLCSDLEALETEANKQPSPISSRYFRYEVSDAYHRLAKISADRCRDTQTYLRYAEAKGRTNPAAWTEATADLRALNRDSTSCRDRFRVGSTDDRRWTWAIFQVALAGCSSTAISSSTTIHGTTRHTCIGVGRSTLRAPWRRRPHWRPLTLCWPMTLPHFRTPWRRGSPSS